MNSNVLNNRKLIHNDKFKINMYKITLDTLANAMFKKTHKPRLSDQAAGLSHYNRMVSYVWKLYSIEIKFYIYVLILLFQS